MNLRMSGINRKTLAVGTAVVGLVCAGGLAYAAHGGMGGMGLGLHRLMERLELNEEQEVKAVRLMRTGRERRHALGQDFRNTMDEIRLELSKAQPDSDRIHQRLDELAQARVKMMHTMVDGFLELHATLSDTQRAELVEAMEKMKERRRRWRDGE